MIFLTCLNQTSTAMKDCQIQEFAIRFRNPMERLQILEDFVAVSILIEFDSINVHAIIRYPQCLISLSFQ